MTPTKLLIGQILIVFANVIAGVWAATQWAAAALGYQAQLGAPWAVLLSTPCRNVRVGETLLGFHHLARRCPDGWNRQRSRTS
jgi:hypothetical protein